MPIKATPPATDMPTMEPVLRPPLLEPASPLPPVALADAEDDVLEPPTDTMTVDVPPSIVLTL